MATAGRILIMPKGAYSASATYEMLDLVRHNGTSWLAKKTCVGIEPSTANEEYWHNMFDLDIVNNLKQTEEGGVLDARQGKKLAEMFVDFIKVYELTSSAFALGAQEIAEVSFEMPNLSGYTPLMVAYCGNNKSDSILPYKPIHPCPGASEMTIGVVNTSDTAFTAVQCSAYGVYMKSLEV